MLQFEISAGKNKGGAVRRWILPGPEGTGRDRIGLNRRVFDVTSQFDQRAFVAFGQKSVLRRILARYLPEELTNHPKLGFNYPVARFVERFSRTPDVRGLSNESVEHAWRRRGEPWQKVNARLAILGHFMGASEREAPISPSPGSSTGRPLVRS